MTPSMSVRARKPLYSPPNPVVGDRTFTPPSRSCCRRTMVPWRSPTRPVPMGASMAGATRPRPCCSANGVVRIRHRPDAPVSSSRRAGMGRRPIPARLLLDTGASGLCLILTTPFAEQHGLGRVAPAIEAPIGTGLVGDLHGTIVRLQQLRLGGVKVPSPTTRLGGEYKGFLARTDIDGVIGNSVFEGSRLILDYAGHRAIVEPRPGDGAVYRLVLRRDADTIRVALKLRRLL